MVEFSPATREARVRFPANACVFFKYFTQGHTGRLLQTFVLGRVKNSSIYINSHKCDTQISQTSQITQHFRKNYITQKHFRKKDATQSMTFQEIQHFRKHHFTQSMVYKTKHLRKLRLGKQCGKGHFQKTQHFPKHNISDFCIGASKKKKKNSCKLILIPYNSKPFHKCDTQMSQTFQKKLHYRIMCKPEG